jgi:peptide/nickel transport system permease protein
MLRGVGLGTLLGSVAGFFGGGVDNLIMRLADTLIALPRLFVLILLGALFGSSLSTIVLVIGLFGWMGTSRLVRAAILSLREKEFVEAARAIGVGDLRILFRHNLPNALSPMIVAATLHVAGAIITESSLSFLGLGLQPPTASWGTLLRLAQDQLFQAPWLPIFPGLMIFLVVLAINFVGDGLRDALDPRRD